MNTRFNTANLAALGPLLTTFLVLLDQHMAWGLGDKLITAGCVLLMWFVTSITPDKGYVYKPEPANRNLKCYAWIALFIVAALSLGGCSAFVPYYGQMKAVADTGIATAIVDRREFNDKKLAVNLAALCDSSIGAVNRLQNKEIRDFIDRLCGGDANISADALARFMNLFNTVTGDQSRLELPEVPEGPLIDPE